MLAEDYEKFKPAIDKLLTNNYLFADYEWDAENERIVVAISEDELEDLLLTEIQRVIKNIEG